MAHTHSGYGMFPGGDPRRFVPDGESSNTPEEVASHKAAVLAWNAADAKGETLDPVVGAAHGQLVNKAGMVEGSFIACGTAGFGMGVYTYECDDPGCDEDERQIPDDPEDAPAACERYMAWDFDVNLPDGEAFTLAQTKEIAAAAFLAGFLAREVESAPARIEGEARS